MNLKDTLNAISSPESPDGPTPSNLPVGFQHGLFGPEVVHASLSATPASAKERKTRATSGPSGSTLSENADPLSLWENKLRRRLEKTGSMECILTWKERVTPSNRRFFQLVPSARPTEEIDCGLWPTPIVGGTGPATHGQISGQYREAMNRTMPDAGLWSTPQANNSKGIPPEHCQWTENGKPIDSRTGRPVQSSIDQQAKGIAALWPTPNCIDATGRGYQMSRGKVIPCLPGHTNPAKLPASFWPTPRASDSDKNVRTPEGALKEVERARSPDLPAQTVSLWATPVAHEARLGYQHRHDGAKGTQKSLTTEAVDALGLGANVSGLSEPTEKRGGLNPEFVCWLMGFPQEWLNFAPLEMQSSRKSPPK